MSDDLKYEVCAITGTYEKGGETKKRYKRVGDIRQNQYGFYLVLDALFNPAGVPHEGDRIFLSLFEPKKQERPHSDHAGGYRPGSDRDPNAPAPDEEIPFG